MKNHQGNRVTLKTEDVIIDLLSHYFKMRNNLYNLIEQFPRSDLSSKEIYSICKALPKSLQRNKNKYNQLILAEELYSIVEHFAGNKSKMGLRRSSGKSKYKPYELYLSLKQFTEIMSYRIRTSVRGNLYEIANKQQNIKLFYLINQLQFLTQQIELWAKRRDKDIRQSPHQNIQFIYPESATNRKTLATTKAPSKNLSKYERGSIGEPNERPSNYCLLRASTAKMQKKDVKLSTRCPSAAALLKNQSYKQPLFEPKKSIIKYKHRSTDFEDKSSKNIDFRENNNIFFEEAKHSRFRQKKLTTGKQRKISILNRTLKDDEEVLKIKSSKKFLNQNDKLRKTGMIRKKEVKMNILSNEEIICSKEEVSNKIDQSSCEILTEHIMQINDKRAINRSAKDLKLTSRINVCSSSSSNVSLSSFQNEENTIYVKERQVYKKARRSGKVMMKQEEQLKDVYDESKFKEVAVFNRRRKAMLSTHNEQMAEIQNLMNLQKQASAQKKLQYDENVLLAMSEATKPREKGKRSKETDNQNKEKRSFNTLFQEMNVFLKNYQTGKPLNEQSVFFEQQKRLRCVQDHGFRQKMKQLTKSNGASNIFELCSSQVSNKDQIYNQIHRYLSFNSDSQWIKHMYTPKQPLIQQPL